MSTLLPRAPLFDVLTGKAPLVGSRANENAPRGFISPIEARVLLGIPYADLADEERAYLQHHTAKSDAQVVAKTLVAHALAPAGGAQDVPRPHIVSATVDNVTIEAALDLIVERHDETRAMLVYFVHAHALNLAAFDADFREELKHADALLPDGIGIRLAASLLGVAMRHNINGTDLLPLLCAKAAAKNIPVALVGAAPGVAEECALRLRESTQGLDIPFVAHGYFPDQVAVDNVVRELGSLGRAIVLIGMGSPKQERWAHEHLGKIPNITVVTVGGLFDFFSGRVPRAPLIFRELGLEWLYRMKQEPRRLAKRYLLGNPLFLSLAVAQKLSGKKP